MKSTLLAAAGQLNINIEQRAKQGHHKQSVQLYSRDDVWPSLFLQLDILIDISTGKLAEPDNLYLNQNLRLLLLPTPISAFYRC